MAAPWGFFHTEDGLGQLRLQSWGSEPHGVPRVLLDWPARGLPCRSASRQEEGRVTEELFLFATQAHYSKPLTPQGLF